MGVTLVRYTNHEAIDGFDKIYATPRIIMLGAGYGMEANNGKVLTARHVAKNLDFIILYEDIEKDVSVVYTGHTNEYSLNFAAGIHNFFLTDTVPKQGESGKPYIQEGIVRGVFIGESDGKGLISTLDDAVIKVLENE